MSHRLALKKAIDSSSPYLLNDVFLSFQVMQAYGESSNSAQTVVWALIAYLRQRKEILCSMIVAEVKVDFNIKVSSTCVKRVWDKTIDQIGAEPGKGGGREAISVATKRRALDRDPVESFREAAKEMRRTDGRTVSKSSIMRI